jgi:putative oxidoreductase
MTILVPPNLADLVGRMLLASLFIAEASSKIAGYEGAGRYMAAFGLPPQLLPAAIAIELLGGLMLALGWQTRLAALALAAFCLMAAVIFHTKFTDRNQLIHFEKDMALAGAFLIVAARGACRLSVDCWRKQGSDQLRRARSSSGP